MATAPPTDKPDAAAAPKKNRKKLFVIVGIAVVLVLGLAGGGTLFYMKKKAAAEAEAEGETEGAPAKAAKRDPKAKPAFVALDPFTVNLADREADRYAQIQITLELSEEKAGDMVKNFMPIIRNNILMVLSHKTSAELLEKDGKMKLSLEIRKEVAKALGMEPPDDEAHSPAAKGKPKRPPEEVSPVVGVHFSNFIIQ